MGEKQQEQIAPAVYANTKKKSKKAKPDKKTPEELIQEVSEMEDDFFSKYTFIVIVFVLKTFSDSDHKITCAEIARLILAKFCDYKKDNSYEDRIESMAKNVRNNLAKYYFGGTEKRDTLINDIERVFPEHEGYDYEEYTEPLRFSENILKMILGGTICREKEGKSFRYWFEPMVKRADVQLIESSVISNRCFSNEEKDYYRSIVDLMMSPVTGALRDSGKTELPYPRSGNKDEIERIKDKEIEKKLRPDKPDEIHYEFELDMETQHSHTLSMDDVGKYVSKIEDIEGTREASSFHHQNALENPGDKAYNDPNRNRNYLNILNELYDFIQSGHQIRVTTGHFDLLRVDLEKNNKKPVYIPNDYSRILNPYALVCDRGFMYLIATNEMDEENKVYHFRVDHIASVEEYKDEEGHRVARAPVPPALAGYFKKHNNGEAYFDEMAYTNVHPMMVVGNEEGDDEIKEYSLVVNEKSLNILFDYFGTDRIEGQDTDEDLHKLDINTDIDNGFLYMDTFDELSKKFVPGALIKVRSVRAVNMLKLCQQHHELFTLTNPPEMRDKVRDNLLDSVAKYLIESGITGVSIEFWGESKENGKLGIPYLIPWRFCDDVISE